MGKNIPSEQPKLLFYTAPSGEIKLEVFFEGETVWLTQKQMAELFDVDRTVITKHLKNIFREAELQEKSVSADFAHTAKDNKTYVTSFYNLDAIISVGYRVNSARATQFRIWATQRLKEYLIKGFTLDDERLANGGYSKYFQELLERIRAIRNSERNFYQKVTDIYVTSIDYQKDTEMTQKFYATVQNKMHYAVHGFTAAEIIAKRANAAKPLMGLTSFKGDMIQPSDIKIAKNYLTEKELNQLNLVVMLYLDFAELQASNSRLMKMQDWITKLDEFLKLSEKRILKGMGKVSAKKAEAIANREYKIYRKEEDKKYISDFDKAVKKYVTGKVK